jgi:hypothetical protein
MNPLERRRGPQTPESRDRDRNSSVVWIGAMVVVGITIASILPADVELRFPHLRAFAAFMADVIPSIAHLAAVSAFPQVTRVFLAIAWASVPVIAMTTLYSPVFSPDWDKIGRHPVLVIGGMLLLSAAFIAGAVWFPPIDPARFDNAAGTMLVIKAISTSRVWLGVVGTLYCWGVAMFLLMSVAAVYIGYRLASADPKQKSRTRS